MLAVGDAVGPLVLVVLGSIVWLSFFRGNVRERRRFRAIFEVSLVPRTLEERGFLLTKVREIIVFREMLAEDADLTLSNFLASSRSQSGDDELRRLRGIRDDVNRCHRRVKEAREAAIAMDYGPGDMPREKSEAATGNVRALPGASV